MTSSSIGIFKQNGIRKWLFRIICLAVLAAGHTSINAYAQQSELLTASKVFSEAPLEVLDMLRPSTRLDMLDYYNQADSLLIAQNALGGESRLVTVAPDYLKVLVTPVSTLEIKLLQSGKKTVVMTLYTTGDSGMAQDTEVRFFDEQLRPLDAKKFLKAPVLADFFTLKGSGLDEDDLNEKAPFAAIVYTTGPGTEPLKATLTTLRAVSQDDSDLLTTILTPTLTATWQGKFTFK